MRACGLLFRLLALYLLVFGASEQNDHKKIRPSIEPLGNSHFREHTKVVTGSGPAQCYHVRGVPKSGNTWLASLLAECAKRSCVVPAQLQSSQSFCEPGKCGKQRHPLKEHTVDFDQISKARGASVIVFRDPRDVLCSAFHWVKHNHTSLRAFAEDPLMGAAYTISQQNAFMRVVDRFDAEGAAYRFALSAQLSPGSR